MNFPDTVYATKAAYIDPIECGSTVAYKIVSTSYFDATIDLTDCGHKITWSFQPEDVEKIDAIIDIFTEFRKELNKAAKAWAKLEAQKEAEKAKGK